MSEEKTLGLVVRLTAIEMAQIHALADEVREPIAVVIRRFIRETYRNRFGDAVPKAPTLKHGGKLKLPR